MNNRKRTIWVWETQLGRQRSPATAGFVITEGFSHTASNAEDQCCACTCGIKTGVHFAGAAVQTFSTLQTPYVFSSELDSALLQALFQLILMSSAGMRPVPVNEGS